MLSDYAHINRRDVASLALSAAALPEYDYDRERLEGSVSNALNEVFPFELEYGYGTVAHAANGAALHLATIAAEYWNEYVRTCERVETLKRDYRNAMHTPVHRYQLWCDLTWAREYRDACKRCAIETVSALMEVDTEVFLNRL